MNGLKWVLYDIGKSKQFPIREVLWIWIVLQRDILQGKWSEDDIQNPALSRKFTVVQLGKSWTLKKVSTPLTTKLLTTSRQPNGFDSDRGISNCCSTTFENKDLNSWCPQYNYVPPNQMNSIQKHITLHPTPSLHNSASYLFVSLYPSPLTLHPLSFK